MEETRSFIWRLQMVVEDPAQVVLERIEYFILISEEYLNTLNIPCTRVENEIARARCNDMNSVGLGTPVDALIVLHRLRSQYISGVSVTMVSS